MAPVGRRLNRELFWGVGSSASWRLGLAAVDCPTSALVLKQTAGGVIELSAHHPTAVRTIITLV
jgi:hypothetical protein